jgi:glycosyltransferase involved in cell wall biosynthesis
LPFGIDAKQFEGLEKEKVKQALKLKKENIVITFIGRLLRVKGISYLIEAIAKINEDFILLIVGSGPDESDLKELVAKKGLDEKVRFLGFRRDVTFLGL